MLRHLVLALAILWAGPASAAEAVSARLAEMTLAYDPAVWRVEEYAGSLTASCVADSCESVMLDISAGKEPGARCGKEEARAEAQSLFPLATYHAVNTVPMRDIAIVLTESSYGDGLNAPSSVFACIARDGIIYRLTTRKGTQPPPAHVGGIVFGLLAGVSLPPGKPMEVRFGEASLSYRSDRWQVEEPPKLDGFLTLRCLQPTCRHEDAYVLFGVIDGDRDCFEQKNAGDRWRLNDDPEQVTGTGGMSFAIGTYWNGCRSYTPHRILACSFYNGRTYSLEAPGSPSCASGPEAPRDAFLELVKAVRPSR